MLRRFRHRCFASRALWLALLTLAFVWQPALLIASKIHALEHLHHASDAHAVNYSGALLPADQQEERDPADPWHRLLHLAHCCGHPMALPTESTALESVRRPPSAVAEPSGNFATLILPQPLRPPIFS